MRCTNQDEVSAGERFGLTRHWSHDARFLAQTRVYTGVMVQMLIGGEPVGSIAGDTYEVRNPATGEVVGTAPKGTARDAQQAIDAADRALGTWADTSPEDRGAVLFDACERIKANAGEI